MLLKAPVCVWMSFDWSWRYPTGRPLHGPKLVAVDTVELTEE